MAERKSILALLFEMTITNWRSHPLVPEGDPRTVALRLSQDCGNALMLILDYAIVRFLVDDDSLTPEYKPRNGEVQKIYSRKKLHAELQQRNGDAYNGIRICDAITTLADVARHLHEFQADDPAHPEGYATSEDNKRVLEALCLDKQHDHAAAAFLAELHERDSTFSNYSRLADEVLKIAG